MTGGSLTASIYSGSCVGSLGTKSSTSPQSFEDGAIIKFVLDMDARTLHYQIEGQMAAPEVMFTGLKGSTLYPAGCVYTSNGHCNGNAVTLLGGSADATSAER